MTEPWQSWLPEPLHEAVGAALAAVHGGRPVECLGQVGQGASGAVGLHLRSGGRDYVLRAEVHRHPARNPHHYSCMATAAEAGLAPVLHYVDADNGVVVMDFIRAVPLERFPGGRAALVRSLGRLAAELQRMIVRLARVTMLTRLYYAGLLLAVSGATATTIASLEAPSPAEFAAQVAGVRAPSPEILLSLAKMRLRDFLAGCATLA